jgi:hypothetical protein
MRLGRNDREANRPGCATIPAISGGIMTNAAKSSTFTAIAAVAFAAGVVLMFVSMFRQTETPTLIASMAAYALAIVCWAVAAKLRGQ